MLTLLLILAFWLAALFVGSILSWRLKWAFFVPELLLPSVLLRTHADWPWGFRWVPRRWFAWLGTPPKKLIGNAEGHLDITAPGTWALCWPGAVKAGHLSGFEPETVTAMIVALLLTLSSLGRVCQIPPEVPSFNGIVPC